MKIRTDGKCLKNNSSEDINLLNFLQDRYFKKGYFERKYLIQIY